MIAETGRAIFAPDDLRGTYALLESPFVCRRALGFNARPSANELSRDPAEPRGVAPLDGGALSDITELSAVAVLARGTVSPNRPLLGGFNFDILGEDFLPAQPQSKLIYGP